MRGLPKSDPAGPPGGSPLCQALCCLCPQARRRGMSSKQARSYRWLLWCLAIGGALVDQTSKYGVFRWLDGPEYRQHQLSTPEFYAGHFEVIPGAFRLLAQFTRSPAPANDRLGFLRTWSSENMPKVN